jgi:predicted transposase YdaD
VKSMCDVAERLKNIGRQEGFQAGRSEGRSEGRLEGRSEGSFRGTYQSSQICNFLGASEEKILTQYSKEEYEKALALMKA